MYIVANLETQMKKNLLTLLLVFSAIFFGCKKNTPKYSISQTNVSLNYDDKHQFNIKQGDDNIEARSFNWTSSDPSVGTINSNGLFEGLKIGKTTVKAEGDGITLIAEVTIDPYSNLCKEPFVGFGSSKATVKSKESRMLDNEVADGLIYRPENAKIQAVGYYFDSNKLETAFIILGNTTALLEEAALFFSERYSFQGIDEGVSVFGNQSVLVGITADEQIGYIAFYIPNTVTGRSSVKASLKANLQKFRKLKNLNPGEALNR